MDLTGLAPFCAEPWQKFALGIDGNIAGCFRSPNGVMGNVKDGKSWQQLWNGTSYVKLREQVGSEKFEEYICRVCPHFQAGRVSQLIYDAEGAASGTPYGENIRTLMQEFTEGKSLLTAKPTWLHIEASALCNLNCIMCAQSNQKNETNSNDYISEVLDELLPVLTHLNWSGGEPLMQSAFKKFCSSYTPSTNPYLSISLMTNGLLLDERIVSFLTQFKTATISVSVDGTQGVYESIRRGGSWSTLQRVVGMLSEAREAHQNFYFNCALTIQKANVTDLPNYLEWCISNKIPSVFVAVLGFPQVMRADIFSNPMQETVGWKAALTQSMELVRHLDETTRDIVVPGSGKSLSGEPLLRIYHDKILSAMERAQAYKEYRLSLPEDLTPDATSHLLFFPNNDYEPCAYAFIDNTREFSVFLPVNTSFTVRAYDTIYSLFPVSKYTFQL